MEAPNAQYNLASPDSLSMRVSARMRQRMFGAFMAAFAPGPETTVLDVGVTSDRDYPASNYFEALYPWPGRITACGMDDAAFLCRACPGLRFVRADARALPFADASFDCVHAAAVLEHVGSFANQARMVAECLRVARLGVCLTTPDRWFPIEVHTQWPLLHWLPKPWFRALLRRAGQGFLADEANLNLMTRAELGRIMSRHRGWHWRLAPMRLCGWRSNLVLVAVRSEFSRA